MHSPILEKFIPAINDRLNIFQSDMQAYYNNIAAGNKMFSTHLDTVEAKVDANLELSNQQVEYMIHKRKFEFNTTPSTQTQTQQIKGMSQLFICMLLYPLMVTIFNVTINGSVFRNIKRL